MNTGHTMQQFEECEGEGVVLRSLFDDFEEWNSKLKFRHSSLVNACCNDRRAKIFM